MAEKLYANLTTRCQNVETNNKFNRLKIGVPDFSAQDRISTKNFLDSKHVLKVYFKPSRINQDFLFLPLPSKPVSMKNYHLIS
jgi:hypothetical protein